MNIVSTIIAFTNLLEKDLNKGEVGTNLDSYVLEYSAESFKEQDLTDEEAGKRMYEQTIKKARAYSGIPSKAFSIEDGEIWYNSLKHLWVCKVWVSRKQQEQRRKEITDLSDMTMEQIRQFRKDNSI